jgi:phosphatidylserine decarboxylase
MSALTYATAQLLRVLPRAGISRVMGRAADRTWPAPLNRAVIRVYSKLYDVALHECVQTEGWTSFDEFFTRVLREGARPIDPDPRTIVSPADGRVESMGEVDMQRTFTVKGRPYRVEELVGDAGEALRYEGGAGCVIYLSPRDYHRVHAPVAGTLAHIRSMPGDYYPVNSIGVKHVPNLFARNRRVAIAIDTPPETNLGRVTVVMVAAIVVGRITATGVDARDVPFGDHVISPAPKIERGDEIGIFHLGSTAVVFFEKRAVGSAAKWLVDEGAILYGQKLLQAVPLDHAVAQPDRKTNGHAR